MSDMRRVKGDPKRGNVMSTAVSEAFDYLNAGTKKHDRGPGATASAAREGASREAGISPAQAERLWKRWRTMASVDGDVYRALRNRYEYLCSRIEGAAEAMELERREIEERNAIYQGHSPMGEGMARPTQSSARREMRS